MSTLLNPYLSFRDNARDAMTFYQSVFGGDLALSTFGEFHASEDPAESDKIMHGMLTSEKGLVLMGADTPNSMDYSPGNNISDLAQRRRRGRTSRLLRTNSPATAAPSPSRWRRRRGATSSACAPTSSASRGW